MPPELSAAVTVYLMIQNGLTALQYSAIKYTAKEVLLLLEMGANVNAVGFVSLRLHSFKHVIPSFLLAYVCSFLIMSSTLSQQCRPLDEKDRSDVIVVTVRTWRM